MTDYKVPIASIFEWQSPVLDKDLTAPPGGESKGDRYLIVGIGSGAWLDQDGNIAIYTGIGWEFVIKKEGMICWVKDEDGYYRYDGLNWINFQQFALVMSMLFGG